MSANDSDQLTIRQRRALELKAKAGWKQYYILRDEVLEMRQLYVNNRDFHRQMRDGEHVDLTHLKNVFLELYQKVGDLMDCPICMETMERDNAFLPSCGHLLCKTCKNAPQCPPNCPVCRRPF